VTKRTAIPKLAPHEGSWVVTSPNGRITELFERENVEKAAAAGYKIETIGDYLARFNKQAGEKMYHLFVKMVDRRGKYTGAEDQLTSKPVTHREAMIIKSKFRRKSQPDIFVREVS
jgi:hypothetical protein